jgi:hypothetical protein
MMGELAPIVAFNAARLAEDEAAAKAAARKRKPPWRAETWGHVNNSPEGASPSRHDGGGVAGTTDGRIAVHVARHDPARALRQVAAVRRIMARHHADDHGMCAGCPTGTAGDPEYPIDECPEQRDVAGIWSDHPECQEGWKP